MLSMSMIKDINTDTDSSDAAFFLNVGGTLYFQATDGFTGKELFRSDGTPEGTYLVDDIIPGKQNSFPEPIAALDDNRFLMTVQEGPTGLWVSDGTTAGTQKVSDVVPDPNSLIGVAGGRMFFDATTPATGQELWTSDGTAAGTHLVKDINPGSNRSNIGPFTAAGGIAYFAADDGVHGQELWRSDGTEAGTYLVKDVLPGTSGSSLSGLATLGNNVYFTATDGVNGVDLWKSDGTAAGTVRAVPMYLQNYSRLYPVGNSLYLVNNSTLIKTDGTPAGTSGTGISAPSQAVYDLQGIYDLNGTAVFIVGNKVWRSDGTAAGTSIVATSQYFITEAAATPSGIYYISEDNSGSNAELWRSDGTTAGTFIVDTPALLQSGLRPTHAFSVVGENIYFGGLAEGIGFELFKVIPGATGSILVKDINSTIPFGSEPKIFRTIGNYTYFLTRTDSQYSSYLVWRTDGTAEGTVFLFDSGYEGLGLKSLDAVAFGNLVALKLGPKIWITGPQPGTARVLFQSDTDYDLSPPVAYGGRIYFQSTSITPTDVNQLWVSNGQTNSLVQLPPNLKALNAPGNLYLAGGLLYFSAEDSSDNLGLWRTDGTLAGTFPVTNHGPESGNGWPDPMFAVDSALYFLVTDPDGKRRLWKTDGTPEGTYSVAPSLTVYYDPTGYTPFGALDGSIYFPALLDGSTTGAELWKSDGTPEGTSLVKDVNPGKSGSDIREFETVGSKLFFTALGQLYVTDGTDAGTVPLAPELNQNTSPEIGGANGGPQQLTAVGPFLYFVGGDNIRGIELCRSDGTPTGTVMVEDIDPGIAGGLYHLGTYLEGVTTLAALGDQVIFGATDGVHGFEPWKASYDGEPIADAGAGYQVAEGQFITLSGAASRSGSRPIVSYEWDLDYRSADAGFQVDATGPTTSIGNLDGPASYTVALRVTDDAGVSSIDIGKINVTNVPPTLATSGASTVAEGSLYTLNLSVLGDPGFDTIQSWKINWGDGNIQSVNGNPSSVTHVFANGPADFVIAASATDEDGTYNTGGPTVSVTNVPPTSADIGPDRTVNEGTKVSMSATFVDPGIDPWVYKWHVTSDNGQIIADGTAKTFDFTPSDNGIYTVEFTVTDDGGGSTSDTAIITVNNLPPTVELGNSRTSIEGAPFNLTATEADPGTADVLTRHWTIQFPDGSIVDGGTLPTVSLIPPDNGIYTVFITLSDDDGGSASDSVVITVNNVPPTVNLGAPTAVFTGATFDLNLTVSDPGQDTISKLLVTWGDGNTSTLNAAGIVQHSYVTLGAYTISVTATDEDGTYPAVTRAILITPRPTLTGTTLTINGTPQADTVLVTANGGALDVSINGLLTSYNYADVAQVAANLSGGDDAMTYTGPVPTGTVDLGTGNDTFTLDDCDTSIPVTVLGNLGTDTLRINPNAARPVTFNGGSGSDTVYLTGSAGDDVIALTPASATITGPGTVNPVTLTLSAVELRHVDAGAGNDSITLTEQGLAGLSETISGGDGDDTFNIGDPATSNVWTNSVSLSGDAGNDALIYNDQGSGKTFVYALTATRFTRSTNSALSGFETITLNAGALPDRIDVTPSTTTAFIINAGNPALTAPADRLGLPSSTTGAILNLTGTDSGTYTFADGRQPISFTGVEQLSPPDSTRPKVSSAAFHPAARPSIQFNFSENVMGSVDLPDLQVTNLTTGQLLPSSAFRLSVSGGLTTNTSASWIPFDMLADGNYRARIPAASIMDPSGNTMLADFTLDFFVLAGDATSDRVVNFADLVAVAQNYNSTNKSWAEGDFTGDRVVDFQDLVIVAQHYNGSLPAPPSGALPVAAMPILGFAPVQTAAGASGSAPLKTADSSDGKRPRKPVTKPLPARPRMIALASREQGIPTIQPFAPVLKRPITSAFGSKRILAVNLIADSSEGYWGLV